MVYLSPTYEGKVHDKKIADEEQVVFPDEIQLVQDTGFQGFCPENVHLVQAFKKPKKRELTKLQKWFNRYVASIRIVVENAISGVKRARIVKDKFRYFCIEKRDQVIEICTGLHNFRVRSPLRAYKSNRKWALQNLLE